MFAAKELSELMPVGTEVIVYDDEQHEMEK
jgi:hypothetical protein